MKKQKQTPWILAQLCIVLNWALVLMTLTIVWVWIPPDPVVVIPVIAGAVMYLSLAELLRLAILNGMHNTQIQKLLEDQALEHKALIEMLKQQKNKPAGPAGTSEAVTESST